MSKIKTIIIVSWTFIVVIIVCVVYWNSDKPKEVQAPFIVEKQEVQTPVVDKNLSLRDSIVAYGMKFLGTPYVTSGCSEKGFDCSGFVYFVFQHFKVNVPRSSAAFENFGTEIPIDAVEKGDVLLFLSPTRDAIGHIGIVSKANGMKSDFIHATSGREMQVVVTPLTNEGYTRRFVKAIRVIE